MPLRGEPVPFEMINAGVKVKGHDRLIDQIEKDDWCQDWDRDIEKLSDLSCPINFRRFVIIFRNIFQTG